MLYICNKYMFKNIKNKQSGCNNSGAVLIAIRKLIAAIVLIKYIMAAPYRNKNAEKWNFRQAVVLFNEAIDLSNETETVTITNPKGEVTNVIQVYSYDFIGEIAGELNTFHKIFKHLTDRFPTLKRKHDLLLNNIERNCYSNTKKGYIKEATGIVNLKSNYKWTDRVDNTTGGEKIQQINPLDELKQYVALNKQANSGD